MACSLAKYFACWCGPRSARARSFSTAETPAGPPNASWSCPTCFSRSPSPGRHASPAAPQATALFRPALASFPALARRTFSAAADCHQMSPDALHLTLEARWLKLAF